MKTYTRLVFILKNILSSNQKIALDKNTKVMHMHSILAMDWQVARHLEIRVLDVAMQVDFTERKDARVVLEHKCFKICEISPKNLLHLCSRQQEVAVI